MPSGRRPRRPPRAPATVPRNHGPPRIPAWRSGSRYSAGGCAPRSPSRSCGFSGRWAAGGLPAAGTGFGAVAPPDEYGGEDRQGFHRRPDRRILQAIDLADGFLRLSRLEGMPQDRDEFLEKEHERSDREYHRQPPHHGMGSQHLEFQPPAALEDRPQAEVDRIPTGADD